MPLSAVFTLTFGPYVDAAVAPALAGQRGSIVPVDPVSGRPVRVLEIDTGRVIVPVPVPFTIGDDGTGEVGPFPYTDDAGLTPTGFAYLVSWMPPPRGKPVLKDRRIAVSPEAGERVDYDRTVNAPEVPGVLVPIAASLSQVTDAQAAAQAAQAAALDAAATSSAAAAEAARADADAASATQAAATAATAAGTAATAASTASTAAQLARTDASTASTAASTAASASTAAADSASTASALAGGVQEQLEAMRATVATDSELGAAVQALTTDIAARIPSTSLGQPNGPAQLGPTGQLPTSALPVTATTERVTVPDAAARFALTPAQVQPGDLAVQQNDGTVWLLVAPVPSSPASWVEQLLRSDLVTSVQGQRGNVLLGPVDIGADPAGTGAAAAQDLLATTQAAATTSASSSATAAAAATTSAAQASSAATSATDAATSAAQTFTQAAVQGDDLVLTRRSGGTVDAGSVRGPQGPSGTLASVTASTLPAGSPATVANTGTPQAAVLALGIPQGVKGDPGDLTPSSQITTGATIALPGATAFPATRQYTLGANLTIGATPAIAATVSGTFTLVLRQAATGGPYTVTWPTGITWAGGAPAPAMPTTANARLLVHLFWTGAEWLGMVGGTFL